MAMAAEGNQGLAGHEEIHGDFILFEGVEELSYRGLHETYAGSHFGSHQAEQPLRYSQDYAYDRDQMLYDLGDDVHPLGHMPHTEEQIVRPFLEAQNFTALEDIEPFTAEQATAMRVGALLHDIGECEHEDIAAEVGYTIGDVSYEVKIEDDHDREVGIRRFLYGKLYPELPPSLIEQAEKVIARSPDNTLGEAFYVVERTGYFKTAMRAGEVALRLVREQPHDESQRVLMLANLALRVSSNHYDFVQEQGRQFPLAARTIKQHDRLHELIHQRLEHLKNF